MHKITIYTGKGAYQARDIENCLNVFDFDYERFCEHDIINLSGDGIFIVPGGAIRDYLPAWGKAGKQAIRDFVNNGGIYIGICAGSYVAGRSFNDQEGLNFFDKDLVRQEGQDIVEIHDAYGESLLLINENGPDLSAVEGEILLKDSEGRPQAIKLQYGQGIVYLFASHPEGSLYYHQYPKEFSGAKWFTKFLLSL